MAFVNSAPPDNAPEGGVRGDTLAHDIDIIETGESLNRAVSDLFNQIEASRRKLPECCFGRTICGAARACRHSLMPISEGPSDESDISPKPRKVILPGSADCDSKPQIHRSC